jgi:hypothetical protein
MALGTISMENLDVSRGLFIVSTEIGTRFVSSGPDPASTNAPRPARVAPGPDDRSEESEGLPLEMSRA